MMLAVCSARPDLPQQSRAGRKFRSDTPSEAAAMNKCLLYIAPIALIGLMATQASAAPATWSDSMARDIAAAMAESTDAPLVLVQGRRGGGGGARAGGGGGGARAGAGGGAGGQRGGAGSGSNFAGVSGGNRGNVNTGNRGNINTGNVNVVAGSGNYGNQGPGWGGVAAAVAVGAVVGAATSTPAP
jgi:hypothetical protein